MEKVYIWGIGLFYKNNKKKLSDYTIEGYIDNKLCKTQKDFNGKKLISSNEIKEDMKIIIMSKNFVAMAYELIDRNIKNFMIGVVVFPESIEEQLLGRNGVFNVENGKLVYKTNSNIKRIIKQQDDIKTLYKKLVAEDGYIEAFEKLPLIPFCRDFGMTKGKPIDRVYIEKFLEKYKNDIKGNVLEIADNTYTMQYGEDRIEKSCVLHVNGWGENVICGNLETGEGIEENQYDAAIITQTLMLIYDLKSAIQNIYKMLKPEGVALITVASISQISREDKEYWGSYWNFNEDVVWNLFASKFRSDKIKVESFGNVKAATALLYGISAEEISKKIFEYNDLQYPVILGIRVEKEK